MPLWKFWKSKNKEIPKSQVNKIDQDQEFSQFRSSHWTKTLAGIKYPSGYIKFCPAWTNGAGILFYKEKKEVNHVVSLVKPSVVELNRKQLKLPFISGLVFPKHAHIVVYWIVEGEPYTHDGITGEVCYEHQTQLFYQLLINNKNPEVKKLLKEATLTEEEKANWAKGIYPNRVVFVNNKAYERLPNAKLRTAEIVHRGFSKSDALLIAMKDQRRAAKGSTEIGWALLTIGAVVLFFLVYALKLQGLI